MDHPVEPLNVLVHLRHRTLLILIRLDYLVSFINVQLQNVFSLFVIFNYFCRISDAQWCQVVKKDFNRHRKSERTQDSQQIQITRQARQKGKSRKIVVL